MNGTEESGSLRFQQITLPATNTTNLAVEKKAALFLLFSAKMNDSFKT